MYVTDTRFMDLERIQIKRIKCQEKRESIKILNEDLLKRHFMGHKWESLYNASDHSAAWDIFVASCYAIHDIHAPWRIV